MSQQQKAATKSPPEASSATNPPQKQAGAGNSASADKLTAAGGQSATPWLDRAESPDLAVYARRALGLGLPALTSSVHTMFLLTDPPGPALVRILCKQLSKDRLLALSIRYYTEYAAGAHALLHAMVLSAHGGRAPSSYVAAATAAGHPPKGLQRAELPDVMKPIPELARYPAVALLELYHAALRVSSDATLDPAARKLVDTRLRQLPVFFGNKVEGYSDRQTKQLVSHIQSRDLHLSLVTMLQARTAADGAVRALLTKTGSVAREKAFDGGAGATHIDGLYQSEYSAIRFYKTGEYSFYLTSDEVTKKPPTFSARYYVKEDAVVLFREDGEEFLEHGQLANDVFTWYEHPGLTFRLKR